MSGSGLTLRARFRGTAYSRAQLSRSPRSRFSRTEGAGRAACGAAVAEAEVETASGHVSDVSMGTAACTWTLLMPPLRSVSRDLSLTSSLCGCWPAAAAGLSRLEAPLRVRTIFAKSR